jgi:hypothetical protein
LSLSGSIGRPAQRKLLRAFHVRLHKTELNSLDSLRLIENEPDGLLADFDSAPTVPVHLTERGRKTAGSVQEGFEYARSAAEQATGKGAEYSRRLNPFHQERSHRFFGIL